MKVLKLSLVIMAAVLITFGLSGIADALHSSGVAHCDACHTMHNSQDGIVVTGTPGGYLMIGSDPSSTCLSCHAAYGQLTADGSAYRSGGDFYWLTKTFTWTSHGHAYESSGDSHGHNIIAADEGLTQDGTLATAPGGDYMSAHLGCNSCHDPHGKQGHTVLLYGIEDTAENYPGGYGFTNDSPVIKEAGRKTTVSDAKHSAYGSGMSEWCANCHGDFYDASNKHVAGDSEDLGSTIAGNYNAYVATGDITGVQATAYWEIVPFETGDTDPALLDTESTTGPTSSSNVMCLTCHRSHATAFPDIGRWDFGATRMASDSHPKSSDTGVTGDDVVNSYYGRTFIADQRSLCNKCHMQD